MRRLVAKIYLNEDKVDLPDYEYTYDGLIEEMGFKEATEYIVKKHKVKEEALADNYSAEFSETVSQKNREKFCAKLLEVVKSHIPELIEVYNDGDLENASIGNAVSEAGEELYTENPDDLGWEYQSDLLEVEIDGEETAGAK